MDGEILKYVGKSLYQTQYLKELKRYWVFRMRCRAHEKEMQGLLDFFAATELRRDMLKGTPSFFEQTTRAFFYKDSDYADRIALVENHIKFMEEHFTDALLRELYVPEGKIVTLWSEVQESGETLSMGLRFHAGQRKEGCLALELFCGAEELYQIMFWFRPAKDGRAAIWIGALQGSPNGSEIIKRLTKAFFGYRTKNLIFYGLRQVAALTGCEIIYAVTNEGYYAMNHVRADRKLKTDFGAFWSECEGKPLDGDARFFAMPVAEHRKDMSELKPSKRAQHRKRFARLDEISAAMAQSMQKYSR